MTDSRFRATVTGRVQNVGYRNFAQNWAYQMGINGYVRNTDDGDVEVVAEGPRAKLDRFLERLHEGPRSARVHDVLVTWEEPDGNYRSFTIHI